MNFEEESKWLDRVKFNGKGNYESSHYQGLITDVTQRKQRWKHTENGGEFSSEELAKLIERAHSVINHLKTSAIQMEQA